ncbi:hypothetical protein C6501_06135 [Candidatus Poribacteria bacterium]|nr:MAG: hypothetical protein C6501_06135 [Candidatus Poribacteria bacterium]
MARIGPMNVCAGNDTYTFVAYDLAGPIYNAPGSTSYQKAYRIHKVNLIINFYTLGRQRVLGRD